MGLKLFFILLLLVLGGSGNCSSHSHSHRKNRLRGIEKAYFKWVQNVGSRNHSIFEAAKNKFTVCKRIKVNKNCRLGDYTTVQKAIDSIPIVNNCRVVISVAAGTYRYHHSCQVLLYAYFHFLLNLKLAYMYAEKRLKFLQQWRM